MMENPKKHVIIERNQMINVDSVDKIISVNSFNIEYIESYKKELKIVVHLVSLKELCFNFTTVDHYDSALKAFEVT